MSNSLWPHGLQHARLPCPSPSAGICSNSSPLSQWCHPSILSVVPFPSCLQSLPASGSFLKSWLFESGGQSIGASASILPVNIQDWFPIGLTGLISLLSKELSRICSSTTVWKRQLHKNTFFTNMPLSKCSQGSLSNFLLIKGLEIPILKDQGWKADLQNILSSHLSHNIMTRGGFSLLPFQSSVEAEVRMYSQSRMILRLGTKFLIMLLCFHD